MTVEELKAGAEELGYYLTKKPPKQEKKLPCICGRKNLDTWYYSSTSSHFMIGLECPNCGRKTDCYKTISDAKTAWNRMIKEELYGINGKSID